MFNILKANMFDYMYIGKILKIMINFENLAEEDPIDPSHFNAAVLALSNSSLSKKANEVLYNFSQREDSFTVVEPIIEGSFCDLTKITALTILPKFISQNWNSLNEEQQQHYKELSFSYFDNFITNNCNEGLITQTELLIINILKYEWPQNWPSFVSDLMNLLQQNAFFVKYVLEIFTILGEEITNFSQSSNLVSTRAAIMLEAYRNESQTIFSFLESVFTGDFPKDVIFAAIKLFKTLFSILPIPDLLQTSLFEGTISTILPIPDYTIQMMSVIDQINPFISHSFESLDSIMSNVFQILIQSLSQFFHDDNISDSFSDLERDSLVYYLTSFISQFLHIFDNEELFAYLQQGLTWLFHFIDKSYMYRSRMCFEMWLDICRKVYSDFKQKNEIHPFYDESFKHLRRLLVNLMDNPSEFLMDRDDNSMEQQKLIKTDATEAFITEKNLLIYLTNIDKDDTINVINEAFSDVSSAELFDVDIFQSICWASGSIQRALSEKEEAVFITQIINDMIQLIESQTDINLKADIAIGLIYIASQYTRFLNHYIDLLYSVMTKFLEFTALGNLKLQDASIRAMRTIALASQRNLANNNDNPSFLDQLFEDFSSIFEPLTQENTFEMYEILGIIIQGVSNSEEQIQHYIELLTTSHVQNIYEYHEHPQCTDNSYSQQLYLSLKCLLKVCYLFGTTFLPILNDILPNIVDFYMLYSSFGTEIASSEQLTDFSQINIARAINETIIGIICITVRHLPFLENLWRTISQPIFEIILPNYPNSHPLVRTPALLDLLSSFPFKYKTYIGEYLPQIFEQLYYPTVEMIHEEFSEFLSFKVPLIEFISSYIISSFFFSLPGEIISHIIETLKWLCQHPQQEISEKAITCFSNLLSNIPKPTINEFENEYGGDLLLFAFSLITDSVHRYAFIQIFSFLRNLLLFPGITEKIPQILEPLSSIFTRIRVRDLHESLLHLVSIANHPIEFKKELCDFLVAEKQFSPRDPALFQPELQQLLQEIAQKDEEVGIQEEDSKIGQEHSKKMKDLAMFISGFSLH